MKQIEHMIREDAEKGPQQSNKESKRKEKKIRDFFVWKCLSVVYMAA